jgi:hypothetical protein
MGSVSTLLEFTPLHVAKKHSKAGAGKPTLISKVIDDLTERLHDEGLAYFYCYRNEDRRRNPDNVLLSDIKQLSISSEQHAIQDCLVQLYNRKRRDGNISS